jgi:hypothetical protein
MLSQPLLEKRSQIKLSGFRYLISPCEILSYPIIGTHLLSPRRCI